MAVQQILKMTIESKESESGHFLQTKLVLEMFCKNKIVGRNVWRHDTQHNDTLHNDTQHNGTQHNDTQYNDTQHNGTQHNDTQYNDSQHNDTRSV